MAKPGIAKILADLKRRFPDAFPTSNLGSKRLHELVTELQYLFPDVLPIEQLDEEFAKQFLPMVRRNVPNAFTDGNVDWEQIIRHLHTANAKQSRIFDERVDEVVAILKGVFPDVLQIREPSDKRVPAILTGLKRLLPFAFLQHDEIGEARALDILMDIKTERPSAFPSGKLDWRQIIRFLYTLNALNASTESRYSAKIVSHFEEHFPDAYPMKGLDNHRPSRPSKVMEALMSHFPDLFMDTVPFQSIYALLRLKVVEQEVPEAFHDGKANWQALIPQLYRMNVDSSMMSEHDARPLAKKIASIAPGAYPVGALGDNRINDILCEIQQRFSSILPGTSMNDKSAADMLETLKRGHPRAFHDGKVDWHLIVRQLHMLDSWNMAVSRQHTRAVLDEIKLEFPDAFPSCEITNEHMPRIMAKLQEHFPDAFPPEFKIQSHQDGLAFLEAIKRALPGALRDDKVDWMQVAQYVYTASEVRGRFFDERTDEVMAELENDFHAALPVSEVTDEQIPKILTILRKRLSSIFPQSIDKALKQVLPTASQQGIIDELRQSDPDRFRNTSDKVDAQQSQQTMAMLREHYPEAFPEGKVDWRLLIRILCKENHQLEVLSAKEINRIISVLEERHPNALPTSGMGDELTSRVMMELWQQFPTVFPPNTSVTPEKALSALESFKSIFPDAYPEGKVNWREWVSAVHKLSMRNLQAVAGETSKFTMRLMKRFPDAFPESEIDDERMPKILDMLRRKFPQAFTGKLNSMYDKETLAEMKQQFRHAFSGTRVNWGQITYFLFLWGAETESSRVPIMSTEMLETAARLRDKFPGAFPYGRVDDTRVPAILRELKRIFPDMFLVDKIDAKEAQAILVWMSREFPKEFLDGQVEWEKVLYRLYYRHYEVDMEMNALAMQLKTAFPVVIRNGEMDAEQAPEIIECLRRSFPHAFPNIPDSGATQEQASGILARIIEKFPEAFSGNEVNWRLLVHNLLQVAKANELAHRRVDEMKDEQDSQRHTEVALGVPWATLS